ncbi:YeeE/YedE family protein [bacterium]|nr:YeeE/YedE family protein [bacterium]
MLDIRLRSFAAAAILLAIAAGAWLLSADPAAKGLVFSLLTGAGLGVVLQRSRFCFLCNLRDFLDERDPRGVLAILVALGFGAILYSVVVMSWVPVPQPGRLPPNAHIGPVGPVLAVASFVFGLGMAISGSCLSAHFYRLGEGSATSPFAIVGAAVGFLLGFLTWNPLYLWSISESPALWLPHFLGHAGSLTLTLLIVGLLGILVHVLANWADWTAATAGPSNPLKAILVDRWPPVAAGLLVGTLSAIFYFRVAPLGVTAELGSLVRTGASGIGLLPGTLLGLDTLRGCATVVKQALLSNNGILVVGLVAGSLASALAADQFRPRRPTARQIARSVFGGLLLGWGAMTSLGCTVGVLLSGIHAGAVSGWVFLVFCTLGAWSGLRAPVLRRLAK